MIPFHARLNMCPHNLSIIYHVVAQFVLCGQSDAVPSGRQTRGTQGGEGEADREKESWRIAGLARHSFSCVDLLPNGTLRTQVQN